MSFVNVDYIPPWYLRNGLMQTLITDYWYSRTWKSWDDRLPKIPWQEHIFTGAEGVPLWGIWTCPEQAIGTLILSTGITGQVKNAWYAHIFARKAFKHKFAILLYDWRGHGKTAELSSTPSSYGWREGADQVCVARQMVALGCPSTVGLVGFSLGGQLALWGIKAAVEERSNFICCAGVLSPNLESSRSLARLQKTIIGRMIESAFVKNLRAEVRKRQQLFPATVKPNPLDRINSIDSFDREIVIDYYGFANVQEYYQKTSILYWLDSLSLPYAIAYAKDDPMYEPDLLPELISRTNQNPNAHLILTDQGGHSSHIAVPSKNEDEFWGMNRLLEFFELQMSS